MHVEEVNVRMIMALSGGTKRLPWLGLTLTMLALLAAAAVQARTRVNAPIVGAPFASAVGKLYEGLMG